MSTNCFAFKLYQRSPRGRKKVLLSGILYLHRISDNRMAGTPLKNLKMFEKLCGHKACSQIVMVTTMWDELGDEEVGEQRERELISTFWAPMINRGSSTVRYQNTNESAWSILEQFLSTPRERHELRLQRELVELQKTLPNTAAGKELSKTITEFAKKQGSLMRTLQEQMRKPDMEEEIVNLLRGQYEELERQRQEVLKDMEALRVPIKRKLREALSGIPPRYLRWFKSESQTSPPLVPIHPEEESPPIVPLPIHPEGESPSTVPVSDPIPAASTLNSGPVGSRSTSGSPGVSDRSMHKTSLDTSSPAHDRTQLPQTESEPRSIQQRPPPAPVPDRERSPLPPPAPNSHIAKKQSPRQSSLTPVLGSTEAPPQSSALHPVPAMEPLAQGPHEEPIPLSSHLDSTSVRSSSPQIAHPLLQPPRVSAESAPSTYDAPVFSSTVGRSSEDNGTGAQVQRNAMVSAPVHQPSYRTLYQSQRAFGPITPPQVSQSPGTGAPTPVVPKNVQTPTLSASSTPSQTFRPPSRRPQASGLLGTASNTRSAASFQENTPSPQPTPKPDSVQWPLSGGGPSDSPLTNPTQGLSSPAVVSAQAPMAEDQPAKVESQGSIASIRARAMDKIRGLQR